jgi:hypothetical protein
MKLSFSCKIIFFLSLFAVISMPSSSHAEFYSYRDANGVLRFTDTLVESPINDDATLRRHHGAQNNAGNFSARPEPEAAPGKSAGAITLETRAYQTHQTLNHRKARLESEYEELITAHRTLKKKAETVHTFSELQIYNENASQLNLKIQDFEKRRRAYETAVQTFLDGN